MSPHASTAKDEHDFVQFFLAEDGEHAAATRKSLALVEAEISRLAAQQEKMQSALFFKRKKRRLLGALQTTLIQLRGRRERLLGDLEMFGDTRFREMYARSLEIPRVVRLQIVEGKLIITTDVLYGRDFEGRWHVSGAQRISVDLKQKTTEAVRWKNLTHQINGKEGPPNIDSEGRVSCMGDEARPLIENALKEMDIETMVAVVVRYPECAGARNQIKGWPEVDPKDVPQWYIDTFGNESAANPIRTYEGYGYYEGGE